MKKLILSLIFSTSASLLSAPKTPKDRSRRVISPFANSQKVRARRKKNAEEQDKWHKANREKASLEDINALNKALQASLTFSRRTHKKFKPVEVLKPVEILEAKEVLKAETRIKTLCQSWDKKFFTFMSAHPEASEAVLTATGIRLNHKFDFAHLLIPHFNAKTKKISGCHMVSAFPGVFTTVTKSFPHSMVVVLSIKSLEGKIFTKKTTIFTPDRTKQEIIELFYKVCMNINRNATKKNGTYHKVRSEKIDGQQYEFIVDKKGKIRTFYPVN